MHLGGEVVEDVSWSWCGGRGVIRHKGFGRGVCCFCCCCCFLEGEVVGVGVGGEGVVGLLREEEGDMILSNSIAGWMVETLLYLYLWSDRQRGYVSSMN